MSEVQHSGVDFQYVSPENEEIIRDFQNAVLQDPAHADRLLRAASRLFEGSAWADLMFDGRTEATITALEAHSTPPRHQTPEDLERQRAAKILRRGAIYAGRVALEASA